MRYVRFSVEQELAKMVRGKKTKVDVRHLLCLAAGRYPAIQKQIEDAFSITR